MPNEADRQTSSSESKAYASVPREAAESQVKRIAASRVLRSSESIRKLLLYLASRTFETPGNPPKEFAIAVDVLDRAHDFDPRVDAAVRVVVGRLRSKLAEYYVEEGRDDLVAVELPRGEYLLRFHAVAAAAKPSATEKSDNHGDYEPIADPSHRRKWVLLFACAMVVTAVAVAFYLGTRIAQRTDARLATQEMAPEILAFWRPYGVSGPVSVVLGIPMMVKVGELTVRGWGIERPDHIPQSERLRHLQRALSGAGAVPSYNFMSVGDVTAAILVAEALARGGRAISMKRSEVLGWDDVRSNDMVFLGPPKLNPHIEDLPVVQPFVCEPLRIRNVKPAPGEPPYYTMTRASAALASRGYYNDETHAIITRVSGLSGYKEILVLASPAAEGTWAAAEYVTQAHHIREMFSRIRRSDGTLPSSYQVLIHAKHRALVPVQVNYVVHRELETSEPAGKAAAKR